MNTSSPYSHKVMCSSTQVKVVSESDHENRMDGEAVSVGLLLGTASAVLTWNSYTYLIRLTKAEIPLRVAN